MEVGFGCDLIFGDLCRQLLGRSECFFISQFLEKLDAESLTVEISGEVDDMGFDICFFLFESGTPADIGQSRPQVVSEVHFGEKYSLRKDFVWRQYIGGGKSDVFPPGLSFDDGPGDFVRSAQKSVGFFNITPEKMTPDPTAADDLSVFFLSRDGEKLEVENR
jgi:hypothetical protein